MSAPLPKALRLRVFSAWEEGGSSIREIAERFSVGTATVKRWIQLQRESGALDPAPRRYGRTPFATPDRRSMLRELADAHPEWNQEVLAEVWGQMYGKRISADTVGRALIAMHIHRGRHHAIHGCVTCGACAGGALAERLGWGEASRTATAFFKQLASPEWP